MSYEQVPLFPEMRLYSMPALPGSIEEHSRTMRKLLEERREAMEEMKSAIADGCKIAPLSATRLGQINREIDRLNAERSA